LDTETQKESVGRKCSDSLGRAIVSKNKELDCEILALEIMGDHVHLFLSCPPTLALLSNNVSLEGIHF